MLTHIVFFKLSERTPENAQKLKYILAVTASRVSVDYES